MLRILVLLSLLAAFSPAAFGQTAAQAPKEYAIILRLTEKYQDDAAWKDEDNKAVGEHFAALQKLQKEGKLSLAGRTTVKASTGIILLKNMSEIEARAVMEADPAIKRGIMRAEFAPFSTVLKEGAEK